jgi:hypothetical protein
VSGEMESCIAIMYATSSGRGRARNSRQWESFWAGMRCSCCSPIRIHPIASSYPYSRGPHLLRLPPALARAKRFPIELVSVQLLSFSCDACLPLASSAQLTCDHTFVGTRGLLLVRVSDHPSFFFDILPV